MLEERLQSAMMRLLNGRYLNVKPLPPGHISLPPAAGSTMLYAHIPFCEQLCPYCSFNRFPFDESQARAYFAALREEMRMTARLGYNFTSMYIGGGTPTVLPDELALTIDLAHELFNLQEVSCETNPNHLVGPYLEVLVDRVQRLSVGVQSFSDELLKQMQRFQKYGSGLEILARLQQLRGVFPSLNVDMIFNFPSQSTDDLLYDLAAILESGCNQTTFYPLMASPAVERSLARTVGRVSYRREEQYYQIISAVLAGQAEAASDAEANLAEANPVKPAFRHGSAWTFNATNANGTGGNAGGADSAGGTGGAGSNTGGEVDSSGGAGGTDSSLIDEYIVDHEEYPAIGSGGFSYLNGSLFVNSFSVPDYIRRINEGRMSVVSRKRFSRHDQMRYRLMIQLFGLRLDKTQWRHDFGCSVPAGVPAEYAFFKAAGAFATDDEREITLTPKGRYLLVALMRQFFVGVNGVRDEARSQLPPEERELLFGS